MTNATQFSTEEALGHLHLYLFLEKSNSLSNEPIAKPAYSVTPAKAGVQNVLKRLDSRLRGNDAEGLLQLAQIT